MDVPKATHVAVPLDRAPLSAQDVAEAKAAIEATYRRPDVAGVCVADGFGVKVTVERGALQVSRWHRPCRRTRRYDRATHGLRRLVLVNPRVSSPSRLCAGARAWASACWCSAPTERPSWPAPRGVTDDARLRRVQALAPYEPVGLGVARYLLSSKVAGQARLDRPAFRRPGRRSMPSRHARRASRSARPPSPIWPRRSRAPRRSRRPASSKRAPRLSTSAHGPVVPRRRPPSPPRTGAVCRRTGRPSRAGAPCSPAPAPTARLSDR